MFMQYYFILLCQPSTEHVTFKNYIVCSKMTSWNSTLQLFDTIGLSTLKNRKRKYSLNNN